jgi:hypothetical protein
LGFFPNTRRSFSAGGNLTVRCFNVSLESV